MNHTEDPALRSFLAKRVNRPHLRFTIDGIKAMSRGISERQTSHKICQYEYIVFTVCCEGIYGRYCIEKIIYPSFAIILIKRMMMMMMMMMMIIIIIIIIITLPRIVQQRPKPRPKSDHSRLPT